MQLASSVPCVCECVRVCVFINGDYTKQVTTNDENMLSFSGTLRARTSNKFNDYQVHANIGCREYYIVLYSCFISQWIELVSCKFTNIPMYVGHKMGKLKLRAIKRKQWTWYVLQNFRQNFALLRERPSIF